MAWTREQLLEYHKKVTQAAYDLMKKKNHDYAGERGDDPFANFRRCEAMGVCSTETGFLVRFTDKLSRLSTFLESGTLLVADEGVEDTLQDIINYAVLFGAFLKQEKEGVKSNGIAWVPGDVYIQEGGRPKPPGA